MRPFNSFSPFLSLSLRWTKDAAINLIHFHCLRQHLRCQFPSMQHWAATFLSNPNLSCTASACPVPTPVTTETDTTTLFNRSQSLNSPLNPLPKNMPVSISSSLSRTKKDGAGNISASYALRGYGTNSQHQRAPTGGSVVVSNSRREGRTRIEKVCMRSY